MKKILCESGRDWNENSGDEAYVAAMVENFRARWPDLTITCFTPTPEKDIARYGVEAVFAGRSLIRTFLSSFRILSAIFHCDVYVWGGGQILRDDSGLKSPFYRLAKPFAASLLGKPIMAYGVGIGPLETRTARVLARVVLNRFSIIAVRDNSSLTLLAELRVHAPQIELTVDPAFGLKASKDVSYEQLLAQYQLSPRDERLIGITPFGPVFWKLNDSQPPRSREHILLMSEVCDQIISRYNARLVFFSQDNSPQGLDGMLCEEIIGNMTYLEQTVQIDSYSHHPAALKALFSDLQCVVGGRMHPMILAASECTPVLALCFENKLKSFGPVIGEEQYFLDGYSCCSATELLSRFECLWQERSEVRTRLQEKRAELLERDERNIDLLAELLAA